MLYTATVRLAIAVVLVAAGCGKELNADFCASYPEDERCRGAAPDAARDAPADTLALACPMTYDVTLTGSTSKYRLVDTTSDWPAAEADCADDGATTHLVVLGNDAERQALQPHMDRDRHVGHSDAMTEMTWAAVTDEAVDYPALVAETSPPWASGEPDGSGDCMVLTAGLELRDRDCASAVHASVCECDIYPEDPSNF